MQKRLMTDSCSSTFIGMDSYDQIEYRIGAQGEWVTGVDGDLRVDVLNQMAMQKFVLVTTASYVRGDTIYLLDTLMKRTVKVPR